jgi:preprotein translocase subunit YajC
MKKTAAILGAILATTQSAFADTVIPAATTTPAATGGQGYSSLLMLVVFVIVFYFLLIRPQMKRNKDQRQLLQALEKGDEVLTIGGMYGKVVSVGNTEVELEIAENTIVKVQKQAISSMIPKGTLTDAK